MITLVMNRATTPSAHSQRLEFEREQAESHGTRRCKVAIHFFIIYGGRPMLETYHGGCHCGRVRFRIRADLRTIGECNCSICTKKGILHLPCRSTASSCSAERGS